MRMREAKPAAVAFTLIELLAIVGVVFLLLAVLIPSLVWARSQGRNKQCISNLKSIGLSFKMWPSASDERFPFMYVNPLINPQTGIDVASNTISAQPWMHFQLLSNEIADARLLVCPFDVNRAANSSLDFLSNAHSLSATNHRDSSVSYFVALLAEEDKPETFLSGDRNLAPIESAAPYSSHATGAVNVASTAQWSKVSSAELHGVAGNIALSDGSVATLTSSNLQKRLQLSLDKYGMNQNLILFPQ